MIRNVVFFLKNQHRQRLKSLFSKHHSNGDICIESKFDQNILSIFCLVANLVFFFVLTYSPIPRFKSICSKIGTTF